MEDKLRWGTIEMVCLQNPLYLKCNLYLVERNSMFMASIVNTKIK